MVSELLNLANGAKPIGIIILVYPVGRTTKYERIDLTRLIY